MSYAHALEPGVRVGGKYRLVKRLGVGGMGEVWVAQNRATGADVAVKVCGEGLADEEALARFRHEARLGAMLSHRSIVRVFDLVEEPGGALLLVMERLRGDTLERYLKEHGPLSTKEAIAVALPILSALAHAHDVGVVHRDVTPANIFLAVDPDGHVTPKLVDFGIAKLPASGVQTVEGRVLGTPRYMAPERIRAQDDIDGRCDLFSVGVVVYEMLTGASPFAASSPAASLASVLETVVDPDPTIEPAIWMEIQRALAKRPYERPANARLMAEALRAASGDTEANLAESLRSLVLTRDGDGAQTGRLSEPTQSVGGHSLGYSGTFFRRRWDVRAWLAAAVAAAAVLGAAAALRGGRAHAQAAPPVEPATDRQSPQDDHPPPSAQAAFAATTAVSTATAISPSTSSSTPPPTAPPPFTHSAPPRATHPRHAKPVAMTPGF